MERGGFREGAGALAGGLFFLEGPGGYAAFLFAEFQGAGPVGILELMALVIPQHNGAGKLEQGGDRRDGTPDGFLGIVGTG